MPLNENTRRVDFVIAGAQKGGTSALDFYLRKHPEIGMADCKEVHFFDNEDYFQQSPPPYAEYHSHFAKKWTRKVLGEATPVYMFWRGAPRRMWEYNPNLKIIVVLRNPIERAYSDWNMERERNVDQLSFWDAIHCEPERCQAALPFQHRLFSYLGRGFYSEQLLRIWAHFPRNQTLVLKSEELRANPQKVLNEVCHFLGVGPLKKIVAKEVHAKPYVSPMSERERDYLRQVFEPEIKKLEEMLTWDCSNWLDRGGVATRAADGLPVVGGLRVEPG